MPRTNRELLAAAAEVASAQYGLISASQLSELGFTRSTLQRRIRQGGPWSRVLPGVYLLANPPLTAVQRRTAGGLYTGAPCALTGFGALRLYGIDAADRLPDDEVHLIIPNTRRRVSHGFVHVERARHWPGKLITVDGMPVVPLARAAIDSTRRLSKASTVQAILTEAVRSGQATEQELDVELGRSQRRRSALAREALRIMAAGPASAPEIDLYQRWVAAELPRAEWNVDLYTPDGRFLARPDVYVEGAGFAFEVDSLQFHYTRPQWEATMQRHSRMTAAGLAVLHASPTRIARDWPAVRREIEGTIRARDGRRPPSVMRLPRVS